MYIISMYDAKIANTYCMLLLHIVTQPFAAAIAGASPADSPKDHDYCDGLRPVDLALIRASVLHHTT